VAGRYGDDAVVNDLLARIKELEQRLSRLERTPQLPSSASNRRGLVMLDGGFIEVRKESNEDISVVEEDGGLIAGPVFVGSQTGIGVSFYRSQLVGSISPAGDPANVVTQAWGSNSIEGDQEDKFSTWTWNDKSGFTLVSDSLNARRGFDHPRLPIAWNNTTFATSTSATFAEMANWEWYTYHPHLRVRLLLSNDVGNVSEIQVVDFASGDVIVGSLVSTSGASGYFDIIVKRSALTFGLGTSGTAVIMRLEHRRVSGAGTIRTRVVSIMGIDLSHTEEW